LYEFGKGCVAPTILLSRQGNKQDDSINFGNIQLAEDQIPSCLVLFRDDNGSETAGKSHKPRNEFVHDAFEAEKPLSPLVKQRVGAGLVAHLQPTSGSLMDGSGGAITAGSSNSLRLS
jgi:hypothetical protein